ncbi:MAG: hypothetical protein FGM33_09080 [Candidatus Kapabacteria bacterium]|nr:hypothetical protein [Candidatus Kapabacteria bacterium]
MNLRPIAALAAAVILASTSAFAQTSTDRITLQSKDGALPSEAVIKPSIRVGALKSAIAMLQDVDIRLAEIDIFLGVKKVLNDAIVTASASGRADDATTTVEMQTAQALNLGILLGRVKAKSADSTIISDIEVAVKSAASQWQSSNKK